MVSPERGVVERREAVPVLGVDAGARPRQHLDRRRQAATLPRCVTLVGLVGTVPVCTRSIYLLQGGPEGLGLGYVDLDFGSSLGWWAP